MEWAVYSISWGEDDRKMGSFVNMFASREEADAFAQGRDGEHELVGLWTREISEEEEDLWGTVLFGEDGVVQPIGSSQ